MTSIKSLTAITELCKLISVVTPTWRRPVEVAGLLANLSQQQLLPLEVIVVDGASSNECETERVVSEMSSVLPFRCRYFRNERGTAIQRNRGIEEAAPGTFIAFIDDDVRLEPDFLQRIIAVFTADLQKSVGGVVGYRVNQRFDFFASQRWRWYKRLNLLTTFEPGRYDFESGYPINANGQPPFNGVRRVDFMTTACAVWRRELLDEGLRFDPFFRDFGVLEDAHFSLRAAQRWKLLQCGDAHCIEGHSPNGRVDRKAIGYKSVVNYYYVFRDICGPLKRRQKFRFWRYQMFELLRISSSALRRRSIADVAELRGRLGGISEIIRGTAF